MPYDACFRIGKIDTVNDDGSYEVTEKGKPNPISSVQSGDGGTYMVGGKRQSGIAPGQQRHCDDIWRSELPGMNRRQYHTSVQKGTLDSINADGSGEITVLGRPSPYSLIDISKLQSPIVGQDVFLGFYDKKQEHPVRDHYAGGG